ncbi:MAG TPA: hypothetical protein VKF62_09220, partial [Planctomycetota bacterium]|nr:hypothetical protein [Planctomycetota bacterium]
TTAVTLQSFSAVGRDRAVELSWTTASELQNLGFHLHRADAPAGPYQRITTTLIPGLGSSPTGQDYAYRDVGLENGRTYFYRLEDVETTGVVAQHGPVSATPSASPSPSGSEETPYGDTDAIVLREVERSERHVVLELRTGGFFAAATADGHFRLRIPGFESASAAGEPSLPMRRAFVEAAAGYRVRLTSVSESDVEQYPALRPTSEGARVLETGGEGSVIPAERPVAEGAAFRRIFPSDAARLEGTVFQRETKKAEVLLFPLRWHGTSLRLARRLLVRLDFEGRDERETAYGGSLGRRAVVRATRAAGGLVAQLTVGEPGLYRVDFEELFPPQAPEAGTGRNGTPVSSLRLSRQGASVPFHVEPEGDVFRTGSSLYFVSDRSASNPHGDVVYELETGVPGLLMGVVKAAPARGEAREYLETVEKEENHYYQAGLVEAPDPWFWDLLL